MEKNEQSDRQIKQYDKIFRENLNEALPGIMRLMLGIEPIEMEDLPDSVQHTKERQPDVLKKVKDTNGETFILHIEFQLSNEPKMVYRMAEYYIMLARKFELPIRPYVIYIGDGKPDMTDKLELGHLRFGFRLLVLGSVDYHLFLRSKKPEEIILALLADLGKEDPKIAVNAIVKQVLKSASGELAVKKYMQQLRILAQLRNLVTLNNEIMESLAKYLVEENDILYIRGEQKGEIKGEINGEIKGVKKAKQEMVKNLLLETDFSVERIASIAAVSIDFVLSVKKELNQ